MGEQEVVASLWSGGLDSTIATYYFANEGWTIQPYHILIRMGSGKDAREREAIIRVYEALKDQFPNVLPPIRVKHKIRPSDRRNQDIIEFVRDEFGVKKVILGTHHTTQTSTEDSNWKCLTERTGVDVWDLQRLGYPEKRDQFLVGVELLGVKVLEMTFSCQLWFRKPCGRCFSCKDRAKLFEEVDAKE